MAYVFISYSRRDLSFANYLNDIIKKSGDDTWVDLQDIPPSAQWQQEIYDALDAADIVICVLSPDYVSSPSCINEVNRAIETKKRIIPVVCRDVELSTVPSTLRQLNWIFSRPSDDLEIAQHNFLFALKTDLDYWHKASQLLVRAREWNNNKRNRGFLLHGTALGDAERWLIEGTNKQPTPTSLHADFIAASRRDATRRQRTVISVLSLGLIITLLLSTISTILFVQTKQANNTIIQQNYSQKVDAFAAQANTVLASGQLDRALLMDLYATKHHVSSATRGALLQALNTNTYLDQIIDDGRGHTPAYGNDLTDASVNIQLSADGKTLLVTTVSTLSIYDLPAGKLRFPSIDISKDLVTISSSVLSSDGNTIFTKSEHTLASYDAHNGRSLGVFANLDDNLSVGSKSLAISPDSTLLASSNCASDDCTAHSIVLWKVANHSQLAVFPLNGKTDRDIISLAFSGDSNTLASAECDDEQIFQYFDCKGSWITTWDTAKIVRKQNHQLDETTEGDAKAIAFSSDSKTIAIGGKKNSCTGSCEQGKVALYDAASLHLRQYGVDSEWSIFHIAFTPDGQKIIADIGPKGMRIWNVSDIQIAGAASSQVPATGQHIPLFAANGRLSAIGVNDITVAPDNKHFITVDQDLGILQWRLLPHSDNGLPVGPQINGTSPAIYTPDGRFVVTGSPTDTNSYDGSSDGNILFWDISKQEIIDTFQSSLKHGVNTLLFSPDGQTLASGYLSGEVVLWDMATKKMIGEPLVPKDEDEVFKGIGNLAFSPDGRYLAVTENSGRTVVWDIHTRKVIHDFSRDSAHPTQNVVASTSDVAVFTDDNTVILGSGENSDFQLPDTPPDPPVISMWDLEKNAVVHQFPGDPFKITGMDFNVQTNQLATIDVNAQVSLWNLTTGTILHRSNVTALTTTLGLIGVHFLPGVKFIDVEQSPKQSQRQLIVAIGPLLLTLSATTLLPIGVPLEEDADIGSVVMSPDHESLLIALGQSATYNGDNPVVTYNLALSALQTSACTLIHRNFTLQEWTDLIEPIFGAHTPYETMCSQYPPRK